MEPILVALLLLLSPILVRAARALLTPRVTMDDLLQRPDLAWPRGVQEEEPPTWRLDRPAATTRA